MYWTSNWKVPRTFDGVDPKDPWFDAAHGRDSTYKVNGGVLSITGPTPRMYVYDPTRKRQWGNVEITMYFKRVRDEGTPYAGMTAVARSNHLDTESGTHPCDTRGIGARMRYDGHVDFEKETNYPVNDTVGNKDVFKSGLPRNRWIGYKYVVYDVGDSVHMQLWLDETDGKNGGDWQLIDEVVDKGGLFGDQACAAGIDPAMPLTASPDRAGSETGLPNLTVFFRSDDVRRDGLLYKWGSVREIKAP
jgi:hypothetical protein